MRALIARRRATRRLGLEAGRRADCIDIEFVAQYLQLAFARPHPAILDVSTRKVVEEAGRAGLVTPEQAEILIDAHRLYTDATQFMRLSTSGPFDPAKAAAGVKRRIAGAMAFLTSRRSRPRLETRANACGRRSRRSSVSEDRAYPAFPRTGCRSWL